MKKTNTTKNVKSKAISGMIYKFAERVGAQLVSTIVSIILARLLLPDDYALISVVTIMISILNVFVTDGLGVSLVQKKDSDQLDFSTIFWANLLISVFIYVNLFFFSPAIASFLKNKELVDIIRIIGIRIPVAAINSVQQAYASKNFLFKKVLIATIVSNIFSGIVGIIMAYIGFGVWALVAQQLISVIVSTICLFALLKWFPSLLFSWNRFVQLFSYGWKVLITGLISEAYEELRGMIIVREYSAVDLAYYTKGQQFPSLIANNAASTIRTVMLPVLSIYQTDLTEFKKKVRLSIQATSFIMFPLLLGFMAVAENFVVVVLTEKWLPAVQYVYVFCLLYIFKPIKGINQTSLKAIGKSGIDLLIAILEKIIGVMLIIISQNFGVIYLAYSAVLTYAIAAFFEMIANGYVLKYSVREQMEDVLPSFILALVMTIPVNMLERLDINVYLLLLLQMVVGVLVYVLLAIVSRIKIFKYLKKSIIK